MFLTASGVLPFFGVSDCSGYPIGLHVYPEFKMFFIIIITEIRILHRQSLGWPVSRFCCPLTELGWSCFLLFPVFVLHLTLNWMAAFFKALNDHDLIFPCLLWQFTSQFYNLNTRKDVMLCEVQKQNLIVYKSLKSIQSIQEHRYWNILLDYEKKSFEIWCKWHNCISSFSTAL